MSSARPKYAVILAGGEGSRFWPASRPDRPKQLLPLGSRQPLIRDTVQRAERIAGPQSVRVVAGAALVDPLLQAAPELERDMFLVEPIARNTGPALTWAAFSLEAECPGAMMVCLHSDHAISPVAEFVATIARASAAAENGHLVCIGVLPDRPETGYGYVEMGEACGDLSWRAARFVEKPDEDTAREFLDSGRFLWNSGIFVWRAADFLAAVRSLSPEIAAALPHLERGDVDAFFRQAEPIAVDVAVMERADDVVVVEASFAWDDVGAWSALPRSREADAHENVAVGQVRCVESSGNVVWAEDEEVVLFGVTDLVVVRSGGVTLVTTRDESRRLKELVQRLREEGGS